MCLGQKRVVFVVTFCCISKYCTKGNASRLNNALIMMDDFYFYTIQYNTCNIRFFLMLVEPCASVSRVCSRDDPLM